MTSPRWTALALALASASCGPTAPGLESGSGSGSSDSGDGGSTSGSSADGSSSTGGPGTADDTGSSEGSTGQETTSWCLRGEDQPALSGGDHVLGISDGNGDGRSEVWMVEAHPESLTSTLRVYDLGDDGMLGLASETTVDGEIYDVADIDGDGILDGLVRHFDTSEATEAWWHAGQPDLSVSPVAQTSSVPAAGGDWADATGDGIADFFETTEAGSMRLHVGDGTGGTTPGDELEPSIPLGSIEVRPTPIPGQVVAVLGVGIIAFDKLSIVLALEADAAGSIDVLAVSERLDIEVEAIRDVDGDGIADVVGRDPLTSDLQYLPSATGAYEELLLLEGIDTLAGGELAELGSFDLLTSTGAGEATLRRGQDEQWSEAAPVEADEGWGSFSWHRTLDVDGDGIGEILARDESVSLWRVEPCE